MLSGCSRAVSLGAFTVAGMKLRMSADRGPRFPRDVCQPSSGPAAKKVGGSSTQAAALLLHGCRHELMSSHHITCRPPAPPTPPPSGTPPSPPAAPPTPPSPCPWPPAAIASAAGRWPCAACHSRSHQCRPSTPTSGAPRCSTCIMHPRSSVSQPTAGLPLGKGWQHLHTWGPQFSIQSCRCCDSSSTALSPLPFIMATHTPDSSARPS